MLASSRRLPTKGQGSAAELPKNINSSLLIQALPDTVSINGMEPGFMPSPSIRTTFTGETLSDSSSMTSSRPSFAIVDNSVSDSNDYKFVRRSKEKGFMSTSIWRIPGSRSTSGSTCLSNPTIGDLDNKKMEDNTGVHYDLYFTAPPKLTAAAAIRYHLTTRNVLACLLNRALVGLNFCQALRDLQCRLEAYMPPRTNCVKLIVRYLVRKDLHNVSNNPSTAAGLLAWSEDAGVHWMEGWREAFVHCCGMYTRLAETPEFDCISEVSKRLLETAYTELQSRTKVAEKKLLTFKFDNIWLPLTISNAAPNSTTTTSGEKVLSSGNSTDGSGSKSKAKSHEQQKQQQQACAAFDSFRQFLRRYYEKAYKSWRIRVAQENCNDSWLTRKLTRELQADFGALYEYLVDRDAVWGPGGDIIKNIPAGRGQRADFVIASPATTSDDNSNNDIIAQMVRLLRHYDYRNSHTPLLCPFPLLPASVPVEATDEQDGQQATPRRGLHALISGKTTRARDKRVLAAYATVNNAHFYSNTKNQAATNPNPMANPIVEAFRKHEKSEQPRHLDPRSARVGRWVMLYSVLQALAEISVDTPHLFFNDVPYFLNPRLSNTPPWMAENQNRQPAIGKMVVGIFDEASRLYSYCWNAPKKWAGNGQSNDNNHRYEDSLNSFPMEMVDPRNGVPSASTQAATMQSCRKDSFVVSSPTKGSVRGVGVGEDANSHTDVANKEISGENATRNGLVRADGYNDVNTMSADTANIALSDNDRTPTSFCSPPAHDGMPSSRPERQPNHCGLPNEVDNVSEERDEDFCYFNNVSHERQGMPGFRAPLKPAIARSRSKSFLRPGTTASVAAQTGQTSQPTGACPTSSNNLESQSIRSRKQNTDFKRENAVAAVAAAPSVSLEPTNIAGDKGNDANTNGEGYGESLPPGSVSRQAYDVRNHIHVSVDGAGTCVHASDAQRTIQAEARLQNGIGVVGRSDYAPPVEW